MQAKSTYTDLFRLFGSNYCGAGEKEDQSRTLGIYPGVDNCCRYHDSCPHRIFSGTKNYHLYNQERWTISSCKCDEAFRSCLTLDGSNKSLFIARLYFNILQIPCFDFKIGKICTKWSSKWWWAKCLSEEETIIAELKPTQSFNVWLILPINGLNFRSIKFNFGILLHS